LNKLLPLYGCFQECCQWDDLVEHFGELLDVGQRLLVGSIPHFLTALGITSSRLRVSRLFSGVSGKPRLSGFFSGHSKLRGRRCTCWFFYHLAVLIIFFLRLDFSNGHLLYSLFSWYVLAYTQFINLLHLRAIRFIKRQVTHDFNTTGSFVEDTIAMSV
jgi:hypothetical protein